jgi:excisionase family DNA binding protein
VAARWQVEQIGSRTHIGWKSLEIGQRDALDEQRDVIENHERSGAADARAEDLPFEHEFQNFCIGHHREPTPQLLRAVAPRLHLANAHSHFRSRPQKDLIARPYAYPVGEVARILGISRTTAYERVKRGDIQARRFGSRVVVSTIVVGRPLNATDGARTDDAIPGREI